MANFLTLKTFQDNRGCLTVVEKILPFVIKRILHIYSVDNSLRGGHRHHTTVQAAICIKGSCEIYTNNGTAEEIFVLNNPNECLILRPEDWHTMDKFTSDAVLLVLASEYFDADDYIYTPY